MPWADQPFDDTDPVLSQVNGITGYAPTVLALAVATVALSTFPTTIGNYRGRGVLKRLSTTPVPPSRILVAQVLVNLGALLVAAVLMYVLGAAVVGVAAPADPLVLLLALVLTVLAAFAVGSVIAALAPTAAAATAWGMSVYFASLFFAGVWLPLPLMPDVIQTIAGLHAARGGQRGARRRLVRAAVPDVVAAGHGGWTSSGCRWRRGSSGGRDGHVVALPPESFRTLDAGCGPPESGRRPGRRLPGDPRRCGPNRHRRPVPSCTSVTAPTRPRGGAPGRARGVAGRARQPERYE